MYCSGCGLELAPGQMSCARCGRTVAAQAPAIPGYELQLHNFASQIRALSIVWFIYAALTLVTGALGIAMANAALTGRMGQWLHGQGGVGEWPMGLWFGPAILRFIWVFVIARVALAAAAGWGLMERAPWGRVVAIVAAVVNLIKFPFGTAVAIWTLVMLIGYRNTTLYDQL
ncbi:MAG TPA: hypothetical protein VF742_08325 [Terracidiphilus sp.]|jgi:hypothetical protein